MDVSEKTMDELDAERELEARQKVEGALFLAGRFLRVDELVALTEVNPLMVKKVLSDLEGDYAEGRGMVLTQQGAQWKMDIHPEHVDMVNKLATGSSEFSVAEQETLALLAHKKEMKQSILVKIRGNKAYDHVRRFVEMGLVHKKKVGHTADLTLQDKFHEYFRLGGGEEVVRSGAAELEGGNGEGGGSGVQGLSGGDVAGDIGEGVGGEDGGNGSPPARIHPTPVVDNKEERPGEGEDVSEDDGVGEGQKVSGEDVAVELRSLFGDVGQEDTVQTDRGS